MKPVPPAPRAPLHLPHLFSFGRVAHHLSFARAAQEMDVTPTAMSKSIRHLEEQLGTRLFNRTTRSVSLTEAGARLQQALLPALEQIRNSVEQARESSARPSGLLRINSSYVAYAVLMEPHVNTFLRQYPDIQLDVNIDNGLTDIVGGGFDAGVRLGHAVQRDMIAVPLGPLQQLVVVGSKNHLASHGTPKAPKDLLEHQCIQQRLGSGGRLLDWRFKVNGKSLVMELPWRLQFNEMRPVLDAALAGCGLGYVFRQFAAPDIQAGRLVVVLERYCKPGEAFHLYYPNRSQMPGKLRAFIDFFRSVNQDVLA